MTQTKKYIYIIFLMLYSSTVYASGDFKRVSTSIKSVSSTNLFVYLAGGASMLSIDSKLTPPDTFRAGSLDDKSSILELGVGYYINSEVFTTIALQYTPLDIVTIQNYYGSINYQLIDTPMRPYIGFILGYSTLQWNQKPHPTLSNENLESKFFMYGIQFGLEYDVLEKIKLFAKYQYIKHDHVMDILVGRDTIEHKSAQNFLLGVRYVF